MSDPGMVDKLEQCVMNWHTQITIVIEEQKAKQPQVCNVSSELIKMDVFYSNLNRSFKGLTD